eukprot:15444264-Alexandrium_andersonii.AAC.1
MCGSYTRSKLNPLLPMCSSSSQGCLVATLPCSILDLSTGAQPAAIRQGQQAVLHHCDLPRPAEALGGRGVPAHGRGCACGDMQGDPAADR